jgi:hypothetical protein
MYTREDIADLLKRFLSGDVEPYEFDDFISSPIKDPELDEMRKRLARLPDEEPSEDGNRYANDQGEQIILLMIDQLEKSN